MYSKVAVQLRFKLAPWTKKGNTAVKNGYFEIFEFISCEIFVFQFSFFLLKLFRLLLTAFEVFSLMKTSLLMSQNQKNLKMNLKKYLDFDVSSICYFVSLDDCEDLKIVMILMSVTIFSMNIFSLCPEASSRVDILRLLSLFLHHSCYCDIPLEWLVRNFPKLNLIRSLMSWMRLTIRFAFVCLSVSYYAHNRDADPIYPLFCFET